jgi:hypothetical protein
MDRDRITAHGGPSSNTIDQMGSAGTIYIQQTGGAGTLKVSNYDPISNQTVASDQATPAEIVGKHKIVRAEDRGNGRWAIEFERVLEDIVEFGELPSGGVPKIGYRGFTLHSEALVNIELEAKSGFPNMFLFRDDGDLTLDDFMVSLNGYRWSSSEYYQVSGKVLTLPAGSYMVAFGPDDMEVDDAVNENWYIYYNIGAYKLTIRRDRNFLPFSHHQLAGFLVDLDAGDPEGPYYEIVEMEGNNRMIVSAAADLTGIVGNHLVGVHRLAALEVSGGSHLDFGDDRLTIDDVANSSLSSGSMVSAGDVNDKLFNDIISRWIGGAWQLYATKSFESLSMAGGNLILPGLTVDTDLILGSSATLTADAVAAGNVFINGAQVTARSMDTTGGFAGQVKINSGSDVRVNTLYTDLLDVDNAYLEVLPVGRFEVADIEDIGEDRWRVSHLQGSVDIQESGSTTYSGEGSVYHLPFTVWKEEAHDINLSTTFRYSYIYIFKDDGYISCPSDQVAYRYSSSSKSNNIQNLWLTPGDYLVAVGGYSLSCSEARGGYNTSS